MKNWIEELPTLPLSELLQCQMDEFDNLARVSGRPLNLSLYDAVMQKKAQMSKKEVMAARTRDEITTAEARLKLSQQERRILRDRIIKTVSEMLLGARYICIGYLEGKKHIIPGCAWSGTMDWDKEILAFEGRQYLHVRVINGSQLIQQQKEMVRKAVQDKYNQEPLKKAFPGRPSAMHLIIAEYKRRQGAGCTETKLSAESAHLAAWLIKQHPNEEPIKEKTIANTIRKPFREDKSKSA